jgi:hypothetical protein
MEFADKILAEIQGLRGQESWIADARIGGLKRALELFMGTGEARQFLTDNGEDSN